MPIYEYECTSCCNVFEVVQRITESPLTICPDCSGPLKKLMSMSSFQLKGGGWYADGYSNKASNGSSPAPTSQTSDNNSQKAENTATTSSDTSPPPKKDKSCTAAT